MAEPPEEGHPDAEPLTRAELEDGLRFCHVVETQTRLRLAELSASFYALVQTLLARGGLPLDEYERQRVPAVDREVDRSRRDVFVVINDVPDKYALADLPEIDCEARVPLCRARCCTLPFPLAAQDLDERAVRWEYSRPYLIARHSDDGLCVHNERGSCKCTVYEQRPAACRTYDCRNDRRIWVDFEKRIAAP